MHYSAITASPGMRRAGLMLLRQLRQKSTIAAILSAVVLLVGAHVDPAKLDSIALLVSIADSILLAAIQEHGPLPQPDLCDPGDPP